MDISDYLLVCAALSINIGVFLLLGLPWTFISLGVTCLLAALAIEVWATRDAAP